MIVLRAVFSKCRNRLVIFMPWSRYVDVSFFSKQAINNHIILHRQQPIASKTELRCAGPLPPDPDHRGQLRGLPQDAADQDQGGEGQEEVDGGEGKRGGGEGRLLQS